MKVRAFDPTKIPNDAVVMIVGKRRSGKSVLVRDLLFHKRHLQSGIVISGTEHVDPFYSKFIPKSYIYNAYDPAVIKRVLELQGRYLRSGKTPPTSFVVLDDVSYTNRLFFREEMRELVCNGRHYNLFVLITTQFAADVPPGMRSNIDIFIATRNPILEAQKKLHANFFVMVTMQQFRALMNATTEDFGCLVMDNTVQSNDASDCIFHYKAMPNRTFRVGSQEYWDAHRRAYDPASERQAPVVATQAAVVVERRRQR